MVDPGKIKTDVVVAGAGGSGIAAALTLAEGNASLMLLEKMERAGGSTRFPEGMFGAETAMQHRSYIRVTKDESFRDIMGHNHWLANAALVRAFVNKSAGVIDWLEGMGVEFIEPSSFWPGGPRTWHLFKGHGGAMVQVLLARLAEKNIKIHYQTKVKRIVREENGPVTGVIVEDAQGKETTIEAKAVIIATGGYANDKELLKKYTGLDLRVNLFPLGNAEKYGEGIRMGWEAGAAEEGMGVLNYSFGTPVGPGIKSSGTIVGAVRQPGLWINQDGVRFFDEGASLNSMFCGNAMARQKGGYVFRIFDEGSKEHFVEKGIEVGVGTFVFPGTRLSGFDDELKKAIEKKNRNVMKADTVEELAAKMAVPEEVFRKTVEKYNGYCDRGHDEEFAKDRIYLWPVRKPPFYAFKCYIDFVATHGGVKINQKTEAVDARGNVIPGLYAVGNDAGGMYGDTYDMVAAGTACGFAMVSGRMAGDLRRSVFAYIGIKILTTLFSSSVMVKNDAPLSVRRGFTKSDLLSILANLNIREFKIKRKWAFRWLIIIYN